MNTNWPVTYRSGPRTDGPGSFERFVSFLEGSRTYLPAFARQTQFRPDEPPNDGRLVGPGLLTLPSPDAGSQAVMIAAVGRVLDQGPKLFRPTAAECEPLEQVPLNIATADFTQPFPVCVVEFPGDYAERRVIPSPVDADPVRPGFVVACQENGLLVVVVVLPGARGEWDHFDFMVSRNLEERLAAPFAAPFVPYIRAALNYLMLATGVARPVGRSDPSRAKQLDRQIRKARREHRADRLHRLRNELRQMPTVYGLAQEIRLFDVEPRAGSLPEGSGQTTRPHWRRGHWRRIPAGVGRVERRLVFIRPVLVNSHLLGSTAAGFGLVKHGPAEVADECRQMADEMAETDRVVA